MNLTEEQILALAPDAASQKAGKDLAGQKKWVSKGGNEKALWGECQGSGSKPYQTQIDLGNIAFKCSCPSRKFPCKHGLGLLLYNARNAADFTDTQMPPWVEDWIGKRTDKEAKAAEKKDAPVDEAAQAKRRQARENKVAVGIEELLVWLKDIIRNGILAMPEKGYTFFDGMARRMVDAQAPGLAAMVRNLGNVAFFKEGWQTVFIDEVSKIYLAVSGYKNVEKLTAELQQDIRTAIGFTQSTEELKATDGVKDDWLVLGKQTTEEDNITTERNWLYGTTTQQYALVLQFIVKGQPTGAIITPGTCIQAELVFFPSVVPLRAIIKQQTATLPAPTANGFTNWQQVAEQQTTTNSTMPLTGNRPYIMQSLTPVLHQEHWWLQDTAKQLMPLGEDFNIWKLLSLSGGAALPIVVVGKEMAYEPLGVWHNGVYKLL